MALKGNIKDFSLTQLLNLINLARKTGALTLSGRQGTATLYFQKGRLIYVSRGEGKDGLADVLLYRGKITADQAQMIRSRTESASDKELGLLLVNAGYLSQRDILQSLREHMLERVYPLFTWEEGLFRFEQNEMLDEQKIPVSIELENVILEGSRRLREWELLQEEVPDLDASLRFAKRPDTNLRKISLSANEWRVISFIDPRNSIRRIARQVGLSDFEIRRIVYGLLSAGLVELVEPPGKAPSVPALATQRAKEAPAPVKRSIILRLIDRIRRL